MVISRKDFYGNVLLEFTANTVLPSTHDINAMWNGSWNEQTNTRDVAYVGGLEGWWHGKVGFEKSPDYKLNAANPSLIFTPEGNTIPDGQHRRPRVYHHRRCARAGSHRPDPSIPPNTGGSGSRHTAPASASGTYISAARSRKRSKRVITRSSEHLFQQINH